MSFYNNFIIILAPNLNTQSYIKGLLVVFLFLGCLGSRASSLKNQVGGRF
jgi:hypothetical protein